MGRSTRLPPLHTSLAMTRRNWAASATAGRAPCCGISLSLTCGRTASRKDSVLIVIRRSLLQFRIRDDVVLDPERCLFFLQQGFDLGFGRNLFIGVSQRGEWR